MERRDGREDPRREEITTELAPRQRATAEIGAWAITAPSDVGEH
jgi:hypothetical protein